MKVIMRITDCGVSASRFSHARPVDCVWFDDSNKGRRELQQYLIRHPLLCVLLIDCLHDEHQTEIVPAFSRRDADAVKKRWIDRLYPGTDLASAVVLPSVGLQKNQCRLRLSGVGSSDAVQSWINLLLDSETRIGNIVSLPLAGEQVIRKARLHKGITLLISAVSEDRFRLGLYIEGSLFVSRQVGTPGSSGSSGSSGSFDGSAMCGKVVSEARQTLQYALRQSFMDSAASVKVVAHGFSAFSDGSVQSGVAMSAGIRNSGWNTLLLNALKVEFTHGVSELNTGCFGRAGFSGKVGKRNEVASDPAGVFLQAALRMRALDSSYLQIRHRHFVVRRRVQSALYGIAASLVAATCVSGFAATQLINRDDRMQEQIGRDTRSVESLLNEYAVADNDHPEQTIAARRMKAVMLNLRAQQLSDETPMHFMSWLSVEMDAHPIVLLTAISWKQSNDNNNKVQGLSNAGLESRRRNGRGGSDQAQLKPGFQYHASVIVTGQLAPQVPGLREATEGFQSFVRALAESEIYPLTGIIKQPFGLGLSEVTRSEGEHGTRPIDREFKLHFAVLTNDASSDDSTVIAE